MLNLCIVLHDLLFTHFSFGILQDKTDQIINTLLVVSPSAGGGALPAGMSEELTSIKNTQSLVQHQLGDLKYGTILSTILLALVQHRI